MAGHKALAAVLDDIRVPCALAVDQLAALVEVRPQAARRELAHRPRHGEAKLPSQAPAAQAAGSCSMGLSAVYLYHISDEDGRQARKAKRWNKY